MAPKTPTTRNPPNSVKTATPHREQTQKYAGTVEVMNLSQKKKTKPKTSGVAEAEALYEKQETGPRGDHPIDSSNPEAQPDPMTDVMQYLQKQDKRIEQMEKSQTELLQYLQDKFKSEGQNTGEGDGTLGQLAGIAQKVIEGDKPPTTDERLAGLALENMSLMNRFMLKKLLGEDVEQPSHRMV